MNSIYKHSIFTLFLSLLIMFITLSISGGPIHIGIDPSYMFAFNYFFHNNIQVGKDILFTFGPLGFLLFPMPLGDNILISTIIKSTISFLFIFTSIMLYVENKAPLKIYHWVIISITTYFVVVQMSLDYLLIFTPILFFLLYIKTNKLIFIMLATFLVSFSFLIKSSIGILGFLTFLTFLIYTLYMKNFKIIFLTLFIYTISFIAIWYLLYANITYIPQYFYAIIEFSIGNSSALTQNPDNNWWIFTLFVLLFMSYPFVVKDKSIYILYIISLLSIIAMFKYSISREDHIFAFEIFLYNFIFLIFILTKHFRWTNILHLFLIYISFLSFIYVTPLKIHIPEHLITKHIPKIQIKSLDILHIKQITHNLKNRSKELVYSRKLDNNITNIIGQSTIDSYPTCTTIFAANKFNWRPRPIFQSYITYTSYLDQQNAHFFSTRKAPEYLLWTGATTLGNHYLLNDNPQTIYQILNHYNLIYKSNTYILMKHNKQNLLSSKSIKKKIYTWNEWIDLPQIKDKKSSTFILAKTNFTRSGLQKIKKLIYKEFEVFIEYKLFNKKIVRYRLIVDTSTNGIWGTPLLDKLFEYPISNQVQSIRFTHHKHDYFNKNFSIEWVKIESKNKLFKIKKSTQITVNLNSYQQNVHFSIDKYIDSPKILTIKGWAFKKNNTFDFTKKYIVLENKLKCNFFTTFEIIRKDVTKHFNAKNLHHSGFHAEIDKKELLDGEYKIYILLIEPNGNKHMIPIEKTIKVHNKETS